MSERTSGVLPVILYLKHGQLNYSNASDTISGYLWISSVWVPRPEGPKGEVKRPEGPQLEVVARRARRLPVYLIFEVGIQHTLLCLTFEVPWILSSKRVFIIIMPLCQCGCEHKSEKLPKRVKLNWLTAHCIACFTQ